MYLRLLILMVRIRFRPRVDVWDAVRTPFRVNVTDLDLLRHMNNGKYLTLLDLGRTDLMMRSGYARTFRQLGWYPVVAAQTISYRRSLAFLQRFEIETVAIGADETSLYVQQTFLVGEEVYARAVIRARFLKRGGGVVTHAEMEDEVGAFPRDLVLPDWVVAWSQHNRLSTSRQVAPDPSE